MLPLLSSAMSADSKHPESAKKRVANTQKSESPQHRHEAERCRQMKIHPWTIQKHILASLLGGLFLTMVVSLLLYLFGFASILRTQTNLPENVAVIGGADGPTAIFVSGQLSIPGLQLILFLLLTLLLLSLYLPLRHLRSK